VLQSHIGRMVNILLVLSLLCHQTLYVSTTFAPPEIRIAVLHRSTPANPGIAFGTLDYFERYFQVANRRILPNHHVIFDRFEHGQYIGDASEKVGEVLVPWGPAYAAMVGFNDASVNETIRLLATQRVLQVHQGVGTHLSDRTLYPYNFRARVSAEGPIITRFYILASLRWVVSASVWATSGEVDTAILVANRYNITDFTRLHYPGGENLLFTDFKDRILVNRMRTIISGAQLQVTIDLVCYLHRGGKRGMQYFFPTDVTAGWWERQALDYPCTADELYVAAYGHVMVTHTQIAPGTDVLGIFKIPSLEPLGEQQHLPLTCTPELTAQGFWTNMEFLDALLYDYGSITIEEAIGYLLDGSAEYALFCATVLALHDLFYTKAASQQALEERDEETFLELVDSLENVELMGPGGRFHYVSGSGDPATIFDGVFQFALDGLGNSSIELNGVVTFPNGLPEEPVGHFSKALVWRDGSTGLAPIPHLALFPDCSVLNAVLAGDACVKCAPGTVYDVQNDLCTTCPLGSFQNESGRSACDISPPGYFIEDVVLPGSIALCPAGYSCPQSGTILPTPCAQGQYVSEAGSSACTLCMTGRYQPELGALSCLDCAAEIKESTTAYRGSTDSSECICPEGMYLGISDNSTCRRCPAGMFCSLGSDVRNIQRSDDVEAEDRHYPQALPGFMTLTEDPLHPYECLDEGACPGGAPGVCGFRRTADVIACGECDEFSFEAAEKCKECGQGSWLPFFIATLLALIVLAVTSVVTNVSVQATPGAAMTVSAVIGVLVTSVQTLSVLNKMGAVWGEPLDTIMTMAGLVRLKSEVLKVGCVTGNGPAMTYLYGQLVAPLSIPMVGAILCLMKYAFPIRSLAHVPLLVQLTNTVGTIASALFITIVLQCVEPFVCYRHLERDDWSLVSSPSILCYRFDASGYMSIATIGVVVFLLVPFPFIAMCAIFIRRYPKIVLSTENQNFLHASRFLFYRFTPRRYYFNFFILLRNLALGLVPAVLSGRPGLEGLAIASLLSLYCGVHQELRAWRSDILNLVDATVCFLLVLVVLCAALLITDSVATEMIQAAAGTFTIILFMTLVAALCRGVRERLLPRKFAYFICHHKAEAAAQARFLKIVLQQERYCRIFIDSDDLCDLDGLFDIVKTRVKHLVVYLTAETLRRPWCAGEIATATQARIRITPVRTRSYAPPLAGELADVQCYLDVFSCNLTEYNIQYTDVSAAYKSLVVLDGTILDATIQGSERFHAVARTLAQASNTPRRGPGLVKQAGELVSQAMPGSPRILGRKQHPFQQWGSSTSTSNSPSTPSGVVISTLLDNDEAIAVGGILKAELIEKIFRAYNCVVSLMCDLDADEGELTNNAHSVIVVLSEGSLRCRAQLNVMLVAASTHALNYNPLCVVPITTPGFQFPSQNFYEDVMTEDGHIADLARQHGGLGKAAELFRGFFRVVSIFLPTSGSQQVLETQGEAIMDRLRLQTRASSKEVKIKTSKRHGSSHSNGSVQSFDTEKSSAMKAPGRLPLEERREKGHGGGAIHHSSTETGETRTSQSTMSHGPSDAYPSIAEDPSSVRMNSLPAEPKEIKWMDEC